MSDDEQDNVQTLPTKAHSLDKVFEERKKAKKQECDKAWKEASETYNVFKNAYTKAKLLDTELTGIDSDKNTMKDLANKLGL